MQLSLQTFPQLLQRMSAAVQNSASRLFDLSVGSVLRAILEANASIALWMQWLIVQTLSVTRASTSTGTDLDSWMADFSLSREPPTVATGLVTFTRLSIERQVLIPVGSLVKSSVGDLTFVVATDGDNPAWSNAAASYIIPAGIATVTVPVAALHPGASGNVVPGAISVIATPLPGIDFVSNTSALAGGTEAESDQRFRARFQDYINSRSRATPSAISYAVSSLQQSGRFKLLENMDQTGAWAPGQFLLVVDDGSGHPTSAFLSQAYTAVDAVRPIGAKFAVTGPDIIYVNVTLSLTLGSAALDQATVASLTAAVTSYIEHLPIGATLAVSRIIECAYHAGHFRQNIASVSINNATSDLTCSPRGVFKTQSIVVH
jgi:uncharacterized phage protein gp47/JayE